MRTSWMIATVLACAGIATASPSKQCIDDKLATTSIAAAVAHIAAEDHIAAAPTLVEKKCWKRAYEIGKYRLVVSIDYGPGDATTTTVAQFVAAKRPPTCLADAVEAAQRVYPHAKAIVAAAKVAYGERWEDRDLGAVIWTQCDAASSDVFLHELNHKLRDYDCLHVPDDKPLCFTDLSKLPPRKVAHLAIVIARDAATRTSWIGVNDEYFANSGDMGALLLFDELLAYSITTDVDAGLVAAHVGVPSLNLPFMALMTAHYVELLRASDPKAWAAHFAAGGTDRAALDRLFAIAERAYAGWVAARAGLPDAATAGTTEAAMWQRYLDTKRLALAP